MVGQPQHWVAYFAEISVFRLHCTRGTRKPAGAAPGVPALRRQSTPPMQTPTIVFVKGAGYRVANGAYTRDGEYGGAPLFKKGRLWLLRYRVPSSGLGRADGRTAHLWWYIADKDSLHADDGDLYMYRIRCAEPGDEGLPPTRANWSLAKDGRSPAPRVAAVESEPEPAGRAAPRVPLPAHVGFVQARTRLLLTSGL